MLTLNLKSYEEENQIYPENDTFYKATGLYSSKISVSWKMDQKRSGTCSKLKEIKETYN